MKTSSKRALILVLVLLLAVAPTLALGEALDEVPIKLQAFLDELLAQGVPVDVETLDAVPVPDAEETTSLYYPLADYLSITTQRDDQESTYALSVLHADLPDGVDADSLYALFLHAFAGGELAASADAVAWLREHMVRTSYYGIESVKAFGPYAITLSASRTDSEEIFYILHFVEE